MNPPPPDSGLLGISNLWLNFVYKLGAPGMLLFVAVTIAWWREARPRGPLSELHTSARSGSAPCPACWRRC